MRLFFLNKKQETEKSGSKSTLFKWIGTRVDEAIKSET